jgi:DNA mismatch repair protein PMS2
LEDLETFGFRGEAISSLCALAQVEILTATRDEVPRGTKLKLDHSGVVLEKKVASSKVCPNSLSTRDNVVDNREAQ